MYIQTQVYDKFWEMRKVGDAFSIGYGESYDYSLGSGEQLVIQILRNNHHNFVIEKHSNHKIMLNNKPFTNQLFKVKDSLSIGNITFVCVCVDEKQEGHTLIDLTKHPCQDFTAEHLYTNKRLALAFPYTQKCQSYVIQVLENLITTIPYYKPQQQQQYKNLLYYFVYEEETPIQGFTSQEPYRDETMYIFFEATEAGFVLTSKKTLQTVDLCQDIELQKRANEIFQQPPRYINIEHPSVSFQMWKKFADQVQFCLAENMIIINKSW